MILKRAIGHLKRQQEISLIYQYSESPPFPTIKCKIFKNITMLSLRQTISANINSLLSDPSSQFNETLIQHFFKGLFTPDFYPLLQSLLQNKELWYLRHAESPINRWYEDSENFGKTYPQDEALHDPQITMLGHEQISRLPILHFDIAYVSPQTRTLQTFAGVNARLRKEPVITPLIRERTRVIAGVIGHTKKEIEEKFPQFDYRWIANRKYWWRHDYKEEPTLGLERESSESLKCRLAFFFLWALFEGSLKILIVSHSAFYEILHKCEYYELPKNAELILLSHREIVDLFRSLEMKIYGRL